MGNRLSGRLIATGFVAVVVVGIIILGGTGLLLSNRESSVIDSPTRTSISRTNSAVSAAINATSFARTSTPQAALLMLATPTAAPSRLAPTAGGGSSAPIADFKPVLQKRVVIKNATVDIVAKNPVETQNFIVNWWRDSAVG